MKKLYVKPIISFESLTVSPNVSSGCALISTNDAEFTCAVMDEEAGWTIFSDYVACEMVMENHDTICYDIPYDGYNIFQS